MQNFNILSSLSIAEQAAFSLVRSKTLKTGFLVSRPILWSYRTGEFKAGDNIDGRPSYYYTI